MSASDVSNWNAAYAWGDHAAAGYLTSESDPKVGALTSGTLPRWDGSQLVDSAISEANGMVQIGAASGGDEVSISNVAHFGGPVPSSTQKSCALGGFNRIRTEGSSTACSEYCTARGFQGGVITSSGSRVCAGALCDYVSDFETCSTGTIGPTSGCTCASSMECTCLEVWAQVKGRVQFTEGKVGIGVPDPASPLHVRGYLQLDTTSGPPPAADCDEPGEAGRMLVEPGASRLWVCGSSGWFSK